MPGWFAIVFAGVAGGAGTTGTSGAQEHFWPWIVAAGAAGGFLNALLTEQGLRGWKKDVIDGTTILRLGWIGNVLIGCAGGWANWALNGSVHGEGAAAAALLVGLGGSRVLTSQLDKRADEAASRLKDEGFKGAIDRLASQVQQLQGSHPEEKK
jgi:hypothetical protein